MNDGSHSSTWQEALETLSERGWGRTQLLDDLLRLVSSDHFHWDMPRPLIELAVRNELTLDEARALMCLARTWLIGGEEARGALESRVRDLRQPPRPARHA